VRAMLKMAFSSSFLPVMVNSPWHRIVHVLVINALEVRSRLFAAPTVFGPARLRRLLKSNYN
jgi:hypothetical protein